MNFFDYIRDWFIWATQVLVAAALSAYDWPLVGSWLGNTFNNLSTFTAKVGGYLFDASNWYRDVSIKIGNYLSWDTIWSYIVSYIPNLEDIRDWFYGVTDNILSIVSDWWLATQVTVQGWIDTAVGELQGIAGDWTSFWNNLWPALTDSFNSLKSGWSTFLGVTLPNLVNFSWLETWWNSRLQDVRGLIDSAFLSRDSWWAGWQDMRAQVVEFFSNPIEYIWSRFIDWFLGPGG